MLVADPVAIVCGASGGIGSTTVRALHARGAFVVLAALGDAMLERLVRELETNDGSRLLAVPTDITSRAQIDALVEKTLSVAGRIDVLVNVAGIGSSPSLAETDDAELERVLAVNLLGPARLMQAVIPVMKRQGRGSIVNVGSIAGEAGIMGIYSASKFGLRGLTDSVRREVRSMGIDVTLIEPGFVRTAMNAAMGDRLPDPSVVAKAIVDALERPRRRTIVPRSYRLHLALFNAIPPLTDRIFGDARVQDRLNRDARAARKEMHSCQVTHIQDAGRER